MTPDSTTLSSGQGQPRRRSPARRTGTQKWIHVMGLGWTPLRHKSQASRYGHFEVSRGACRQAHDADVNARTRKHDHWTPLHLSARDGRLRIVKLLLERGADVN